MATAPLAEGALLNQRYRIDAILGRGGMGTVYRATDTRLDVPVAVKETVEPDPGSPEAETARTQFQREARLLAQLSHPNLPRVSDYFVEGERWYLVMELIQGVTLESRLQESGGAPLPLPDVLDWAVQLADVLAYLHRQDPPIVFRDLKPGNVMVQADGIVKLIDFGIARRFQEGASKDTLLFGSPGYSPPEQYGRSQTRPCSDLYALGATLHHLLSGRDPSSAPFRFPPLRSLNASVPPDLDRFVAECVEMDEARRCQSAETARETLVQIRSAEEARPAATAQAERRAPSGPVAPGARVVSSRLQAVEGRRAARRAVRMAALVGALVLLVAVVGAASYQFVRRATRAHPRRPGIPAVAAPPVSSPQAAPSGQPASMQILSTPPGATAWLDGQQIGPTPVQLPSVAAGTHVLRLVPRPGLGYAEASRQIQLEPGQSVVVDFALASAAPPQPNAAPAALFTAGPSVAIVDTPGAGRPAGARRAVAVGFDLRITGGVGHTVTVEALFADQNGQPLKPSAPDSAYQDAEGVLAASRTLEPQADPTDFPQIVLYVPTGAFPVSVLGAAIACRVVVGIDGKPVVQSSPVTVQLPADRS